MAGDHRTSAATRLPPSHVPRARGARREAERGQPYLVPCPSAVVRARVDDSAAIKGDAKTTRRVACDGASRSTGKRAGDTLAFNAERDNRPPTRAGAGSRG